MKHKNMKFFISGFVVAILVTGSLSVFSQNITKSITAYYNNIRLIIDGQEFIPKDVNGNVVEPFIVDGTTYLPVRAISSAFGRDIKWDDVAKTISISPKVEEVNTVTVSTTQEFIEAIDSNKKIILNSGTYNLSTVEKMESEAKKSWAEVYDGSELILKDIENLTIEGNGQCSVIVEPRYAYVLSFINAQNINIKNVTFGHTENGACRGGVLLFSESGNINLDQVNLYGCGTEGLTIKDTNILSFTNSEIHDCTYSLMTIENSKDLTFDNSKLYDTKEFDLINITNSENIAYNKCSFTNNTGLSLFNVYDSSDIKVIDSTINDNVLDYLEAKVKSVIFENVINENNNIKNN